jgi:hypothetical protein
MPRYSDSKNCMIFLTNKVQSQTVEVHVRSIIQVHDKIGHTSDKENSPILQKAKYMKHKAFTFFQFLILL